MKLEESSLRSISSLEAVSVCFFTEESPYQGHEDFSQWSSVRAMSLVL